MKYRRSRTSNFASPAILRSQRIIGKQLDTLPGISGMNLSGKNNRLFNTENINKLNQSFNRGNNRVIEAGTGFIRPQGTASSPFRPNNIVSTKNPAQLAQNPRQQKRNSLFNPFKGFGLSYMQ